MRKTEIYLEFCLPQAHLHRKHFSTQARLKVIRQYFHKLHCDYWEKGITAIVVRTLKLRTLASAKLVANDF